MTTISKNPSTGKINYKELLKPYLRNWKWFIIAAIIGIVLGLLKIRYSVPQYAIQAKIQILEDQNSTSELDVFRDLSGFGGGRNSVEDEIEVLNSRSSGKTTWIKQKYKRIGQHSTFGCLSECPL